MVGSHVSSWQPTMGQMSRIRSQQVVLPAPLPVYGQYERDGYRGVEYGSRVPGMPVQGFSLPLVVQLSLIESFGQER